MADTIKCPKCGSEIEVSEAFKHQVEGKVVLEAERKFKEKLEKERELFKKEADEEAEELRKELKERNKKVDELRGQEVKLREEKRKIEDREKELELEVERKLDKKREEIEEKVLRQEEEKFRLKEKEKEKMIEDLRKALNEAQRKASVGSQQLQGEILELDIEESLEQTFRDDEIEPIEKGVKGADVRQVVKSPKGYRCGVILWETKRTKAWSEGWIGKLKEDLRSEKANIPVIISQVLPKGYECGFGFKDGVWVVNFTLFLPLAMILRKSLLDIGYQKAMSSHRGKKADVIYEYITGYEFRQQVEALVEVYKEMQEQVLKERIAYERIWKKREGQIARLIGATASVVGSIQGKAGAGVLQVKGLDLFELESGEK